MFILLINSYCCEITLLILEDKGQFRNRIPKDIKVRYIEIPKKERGIFFGKKKMLKEHLGHGRIWKIPGYLLYNMQISLTEDRVKNAAYFSHIAVRIDSLSIQRGEKYEKTAKFPAISLNNGH